MSRRGVDRSSPLPYYYQLKELIRGDIRERKLVAGDPLPGEHRLCEQYDVSRTVVRQALTELEFEGVIERFKGRGTFVAADKTAQGLVQSLTGQFEDLASRGLHLRSQVRRLESVPAEDPVAAQLRLSGGEPVVLLERLRFIDDEPWALAITYLPIELLPHLRAADLEHGSLYALMDQHGIRPVHGTRAVEAREANAALAKDLGIRRGAAVMLLTSIGEDSTGRPVEAFQAYHRGDRSRFEVELVHRDGTPSGPRIVGTITKPA